SAGVADCRTGRGVRSRAGGGGGVSTELFVSCMEAFAKPLERGGGGTKLAVRIEQDPEHPILSTSLGTTNGVTVDGDVTLEVDLVHAPIRGDRRGIGCHLVSAVRVISTSLRGVIREGDIRAFDLWRGIFVATERKSCGAADPPGGDGFGRPGTGHDAGGDAGEERNAAGGGVGTAADEEFSPPWSFLSPALSLEASLEGLRLEVVGDEDAGCVGTGDGGEEEEGRDGLVPEAVGGLGGQELGASEEEGDSGLLSRPHEPMGLPVGDRGRDDDAHAQRRKGCLQRRTADAPSVVAEMKGLRVGVDSAGLAGDDDRAVGTRRVSVAVKWSSVALLTGGEGSDCGGQDDDVGRGGHSRSSSTSQSQGGVSMSSSPDSDAAERLRAFSRALWKGGLGTAGIGVKRKCLPIHLGKLSLSAEAGMEGAARAAEIVASGRLAFGRFTLSRDGLLVLLWAAKLVPAFTRPPPPPPLTSEETHRVFGRTPNAWPRGRAQPGAARSHPPPGSDGSDAGEAGVGKAAAAATIVRLTFPRVGIRACSTAVALATAPPSSREVVGTSGGASVTVSAESVEGHFEVEDPGTMVPPPPPPGPSGQEPQDSTAVATPRRETHRLRWLAIRKATFVTGGSRSGGAESVVSGGRRGSSGRSGVPVPPIAAAAGVDGLAVEGVWAEWSPALFFLAGQSGAMIVSSLKAAGFLPAPVSRSGLGYDPLQHWSPPPPPPPPSPPVSPPRSAGMPSPDANKPVADAAARRGPPRGFPGDALRLPAVGATSRAAACFANRVFSGGDLPPAVADLLWRPSEERAEHAGRGSGGDGSAAGDTSGEARPGGGGGGGGGGRRVGAAGGSRGKVKIPKVFTASVRDVRVEFPYQAGVCPGDMEYGDVVRWLRRFRCCSTTDGFGGGVADAGPPRGEVGGSGGWGEKVRRDDDKLLPPRRCHSLPASAASSDGDAGSSHLPLRDSLAWSCQYVEAREFDMSVAVSSGGGGGGRGSGVLPHLNCAISGVSVSTAGYARGGNVGDGRGGGVRRTSSLLEAAKRSTSSPTPVPGGALPPSGAAKARQVDDGTGATAAEGGSGGKLSDGAPGRRGGLGRQSSSARFAVALGGTRHCPNTRKRFLRVSKFAVLQMFSADRRPAGRPASRVVDILAEGVDGHWTPATHLKIIKPVREVTLSIWKAMLHLRRAWLAHPSLSRGGSGGDASSVLGGDRCPPWDDPAALEYWVRAWAGGGPSGPAGDTLHR
ncbi:unnamed protein product, partial [Ectocarpus sp. 8 AP-2014]